MSTSEVSLDPGERFVLALPVIPSSGYDWEFLHTPKGAEVLADSFEMHDSELVKAGVPQELLEASSSREVVGAEVMRVFLMSSPPGEVKMVKHMPWDPEKDPTFFSFLVR